MSQESSGSDTPRQGEGDVVRAQTEGGGGGQRPKEGGGGRRTPSEPLPKTQLVIIAGTSTNGNFNVLNYLYPILYV